MAVGIVILVALFQSFFIQGTFHDIDEASYAILGQSVLDGKVPYASYYDNKPPGIWGVYALGLYLTPHSMMGIRILAWLALAFTLWTVLSFVQRQFNSPICIWMVGLAALLIFIHPGFEPEAALTEWFSLPFLAMAILGFPDNDKVNTTSLTNLLRGIAGGVAVLLTFQAILPLLFSFFLEKSSLKNNLFQGMGVLGICALVFGLIWIAGAGQGIFYSLFQLVREYGQFNLNHPKWEMALQTGWRIAPFLVTGMWGYFILKKENPLEGARLGGWAVTSLLTLIAVGSYFPHHVMMLSIPLAIFSGVALSFMFSKITDETNSLFVFKKYSGKFIGSIFVLVLIFSTIYFAATYRWSPEPPILDEMGKVIQSVTPSNRTIFVWGYRTELYWYALRSPPEPFYTSLYLTFDSAAPIAPEKIAILQRGFAENPPAAMIVIDRGFLPFLSDGGFLEKYHVHPSYSWLYVKNSS